MPEAPTIVAYLKPDCSWCNGVRATFEKYALEYDHRDITNDPADYAEMVEKSGQPLSPCVVINGEVLADVAGQEVEAWMIQNGIVEPLEE